MRWTVLVFLVLSLGFASPLNGYIDKSSYLIGEQIKFSGTVVSAVAETVNATITNASGLVKYAEAVSDGSSTNTFQGSLAVDFQTGNYNITLSTSTNSISFPLTIIPERIDFKAITINESLGVIIVNTTQTITNADLDQLSQSPVHYGNATINGRKYHFAIIAQGTAGEYDTVYVDDDANFSIYDNAEDNSTQPMLEKILEMWKPFESYTLIDVDPNAKFLILAGLQNNPPSIGDNLTVAVLAKSAELLENYPLEISLVNDNGQTLRTVRTHTNPLIANATFNLSSAGEYFIAVNGTVIAGAKVEIFKMIPKITDTNNNPQFTFTQDPIVRIGLNSKDSSGNAISLSQLTAKLYKPDGNQEAISFTQDPTGNYYADIDLSGEPTGTYSVEYTGNYGGVTQIAMAGFEIKSKTFEVEAINTQLMDAMGEKGASPNYFSPDSNISIATFLVNLENGGMMGPPDTWSLIPVDNVTGDRCRDLITLEELKGESGKIYTVNYSIMNISTIVNVLGGSQPPTQMLDQCGIIIWDNNSLPTGTYTAKISLTYKGTKYVAADSFSIQKYYGFGYPVDASGNENWFMAPNTTGRIKVVIKDIKTNQEINYTFLNDVRIVGFEKLFPTQEDVFNASEINESFSADTITFHTPSNDGFYRIIFKFLANGTTGPEEGLGEAFLDLKRYIIFGQPTQTKFGPGSNITIQVHVYDVSKGAYLDFQSGTCTNCAGFMVNISRIFNDFGFAQIPQSEYTVQNGVITNESNPVTNITIHFNQDADTGFYGVDLGVTSPCGDRYFGWAWFEIRNFYVNVEPVSYNESTGTYTIDWSVSYSPNSPAYFAVTAFDPETDNPIHVRFASVERIMDVTGFPVPVTATTQNTETTVKMPWGDQLVTAVINVSGLNPGSYDLLVEASTDQGTDKGHAWFQISPYMVTAYYRQGDMFSAAQYSPNENISITFMAYENDGTPHNFSSTECAVPKSAMGEKLGEPLSLRNVNYQAVAYQNMCNLTFPLSSLKSGKYMLNINVKDDSNITKEEDIFIEIAGAKMYVPKIIETWLWDKRTPKKTHTLENTRDLCENELYLDPQGANFTKTYNINNNGEWWEGGQVTVTSNTTFVWIFENGNPIGAGRVGSNFTTSDSRMWKITKILGGEVDLRLANDGMCGEVYNETTQNQDGYVIFLKNRTTGYHGKISLIDVDYARGQSGEYVYVFTNGTYVWINESNFLNESSALQVGDTFTTQKGEIWEIKSINGQQLTLYGKNVLSNGFRVNTSLSHSGTIILGTLEESSLGGFNPDTGEMVGMDLNQDGDTIDRFNLALLDNGTTYNTLAYSLIPDDTLLNNIIDLGANKTNRTIAGLVWLSKSARNDQVRFYNNNPGDWSFLGEFKFSDVVRVPVRLVQPNGTAMAGVEVDVPTLIVDNGFGRQYFNLPNPIPNATTDLDGIAEVEINVSKYGISAGNIKPVISVNINGENKVMEEWKLPEFKVSAYLYNFRFGNATYVSSISTGKYVSIHTEPLELFTVNLTGEPIPPAYPTITKGVALFLDRNKIVTNCENFTEPWSIASGENHTYSDGKGAYYFYENAGEPNKIWIKKGDCNFTQGTMKVGGEEYLFDFGDNYTLQMLNLTMNLTTIGVDLGSIDEVEVSTFGSHPSPMWYLAKLVFGSENYTMLYSGGSETIPACSEWGISSCVKSAYFSHNSTFSTKPRILMGENFTENLYLASMGPDPWSDVKILNMSSPVFKPALDIWTADNNEVKLIMFNESQLQLNLDGQPSKRTYYGAIYDDHPNGQPDFSSILVDDDLQLTEAFLGNSTTYFDFYNLETENKEVQGSMPSEFWDGSIRFIDNSNVTWFIKTISDRGLLIQNDNWNFDPTENITLTIKVNNFDGTVMPNVDVLVNSVKAFTRFGFRNLVQNNDYYFLQGPIEHTDSEGYAIITLGPNTTWTEGDYSIGLYLNNSGKIQSVDAWVHVGGGW